MKSHFLLIIFLLGIFFSTLAQVAQKEHFSPEFKVTFNIASSGLLEGYGFGVGVYNAFFTQKKCNLILGLEYNTVFYNTYFLEYRDGEYSFIPFFNYLGIPLNARVNFGKKVKFFIEAGVFFDPVVLEKKRFLDKEIAKKEKTIYVYNPDFGCSGGVGLRIPVTKYEIIIKSDYKLGMRRFISPSYIYFPNGYWRFGIGFKM